MPSKSKFIAELLDANGDVLLSNLDNINVYDAATSSTGYFDLPSGTTAQRPGSPATGNIRHNTENAVVEFYDGENWIPTVPLTTISSISGNIFYQLATEIDVNFTDTSLNNTGNYISFFAGSTLITQSVANRTITNGVMSNVPVPSSVYNAYSAGNNISISVTLANGFTTNTVTKTVLTPATGGNTVATSSDGTYRYHAFTAGGTFNSQGVTSIEYLVVAGGGGGGGSNSNSNVGNGGGGGAGGLLNGTLTINANTAYTVVVGPGGGADPTGLPGSNSTISGTGITTVTALGGGGGGYYSGGSADSGGSGGGGGYAQGTAGSGTAGQGNDGGAASGSATGGGGGAGAVGQAGSGNQAGAGGIGRQFSHWATATSTGDNGYYAGGGGGGGSTFGTAKLPGAGGQGGGADGGATANTTPTAATANTGGGGGGRTINTSSGSGGAGGSGIVIIRYALK